ncbi:MAG: glycosyltransferase family 2 protein [Alphaproteobacteria bacterium]|nr:glycosyltransferase family 2 protein [Alphaproteobacteria bacterium]
MQEYKKISVVTVAYNCEHFLETACKSFAYQDYPNLEWIIVNDASDDSTAALLQHYKKRDKRVKLCLNKTHKGFLESYGYAISKATGDYVAILEPENFWVKDKISRQYAFMLRYNFILSHTSYAFADHECNLLPIGCCKIEPKISLLNYGKNKVNICLSTFMINREETKKLFPIKLSEDDKKENFDLVMYLMNKGLMSCGISKVLSLCRPQYNYPKKNKQFMEISKLYNQLRQEDKTIPSIMNYQVYEASNVTNININPSYCIDKDVYTSLEKLRNFEL